MDLREMAGEGELWIGCIWLRIRTRGGLHLAQDKDPRWAVVKTVRSRRVPQKAGNFLTIRVTVSFSRRTLFRGVSQL
jgi:hypothetical protein